MTDVGYGGEILGGITANIDRGQTSNPFPSPYLSRGNPSFKPLRMGYLVAAQDTYSPQPQWANKYSLRFHYNPSQISMSFSFNPGTIQPMWQPDPTGAPIANLLSSMTLTWDMFFDRSYELSGFGGDPTNGKGCLVDLAAYMNLLGVLQPGVTGTYQFPMQVVFGATKDGTKWGFTGYFTQGDIQFLTFDGAMIPSRMTITATLQISYVPSSPNGDGSGGGDPASVTGQTPNGFGTDTHPALGPGPGMSLNSKLGIGAPGTGAGKFVPPTPRPFEPGGGPAPNNPDQLWPPGGI